MFNSSNKIDILCPFGVGDNNNSISQFSDKSDTSTISPFTGRPVQHNLLSATVISNNCSTADAYATAFMVMGLEKTKKFLSNKENINLDVYLIYENKDGELVEYISKGMRKYLNK